MPVAPSIRRVRISDARARLIINAVLLSAITTAISAVLIAVARHGG